MNTKIKYYIRELSSEYSQYRNFIKAVDNSRSKTIDYLEFTYTNSIDESFSHEIYNNSKYKKDFYFDILKRFDEISVKEFTELVEEITSQYYSLIELLESRLTNINTRYFCSHDVFLIINEQKQFSCSFYLRESFNANQSLLNMLIGKEHTSLNQFKNYESIYRVERVNLQNIINQPLFSHLDPDTDRKVIDKGIDLFWKSLDSQESITINKY